MAKPYTQKKLTDVKDSAPELEVLAFGPRHEGDGEVIQEWWTD